MILTICPNPSIDCTIELDTLNVGMLNRIMNKVETYSGKALNVAMGVARLNEKCFATGFMFEEHARLFEQVLDKEGVKHDFVLNKGATRVNYKIIDKKAMLTEINDKGTNVSREKQAELIQLVKTLSKDFDIAVLSGSLPSGVEPSFCREILSVIPDNVKKVVDTERANLDQALLSGVYMIKPNLRELESYAQSPIRTKKDMIKVSRYFFDRGVKLVLISLGAEGAILTDGVKNYYCQSVSVAVNSTVGAGDCMVASACVQIEKSSSMQEILRSAVAAGTASTMTRGTNLFYKDTYETIYSKLNVEEIKL